jgi:hypothetical protein
MVITSAEQGGREGLENNDYSKENRIANNNQIFPLSLGRGGSEWVRLPNRRG